VTGLKFIPLLVLIPVFWVILGLYGDAGCRKKSGLGQAYIIMGLMFSLMPQFPWRSSQQIIVYGKRDCRVPDSFFRYALIYALNITTWLLAYKFFNTEAISSYARLFLICVISYLPIALTAFFIDQQYNEINKHYLDKRRPKHTSSQTQARLKFIAAFCRRLFEIRSAWI